MRWTVIAVLILSCVALLTVLTGKSSEAVFRMAVFDIGQGDALFLETPSGQQILIDGGPSNLVLEKLGRVMPFFDRSLDMVLLTHPDADHLVGLVEVVNKYHVDRFVMTGVDHESSTYRELHHALVHRSTRIHLVSSGDIFQFSDQIILTILAPLDNVHSEVVKNLNDTSVVAVLEFGELKIFLPGDAEAPVEKELVINNLVEEVTVLKAGHHGSKTSTSQELLDILNPEITLISVGKENKFGHPHPEVLQRLKGIGTDIYRSDERGDFTLQCDQKAECDIRFGLGFRYF